MKRTSNTALQGLAWAAAAGFCFAILNTVMRQLAIDLPPVQALFLRYLAGTVVWIPMLMRLGVGHFKSNHITGQLGRSLVHTAGLAVWFIALPNLPLADTTAIGFTQPVFIMLGASLFLGERMVAARWIAVGLGFIGVLIVVGPKMGEADQSYALLMLCSTPLFAGSFLIAKLLTRYDKPSVIVFWQAILVSLLALPFALWVWVEPNAVQWGWVLLAGCLGSFGHWCLTKAYQMADISAAQPVKFLDLVWASLLGYLVFGHAPAIATIIGGVLIIVGTIWAARHASGTLPIQSQAESSPQSKPLKGDNS